MEPVQTTAQSRNRNQTVGQGAIASASRAGMQFSVRYVFIAISILIAAFAASMVISGLVSGFDFGLTAFFASLLIASLPLCTVLLLRAKATELSFPDAKYSVSRRRSLRAIEVISFIVMLGSLTGLIFSVFLLASAKTSVAFYKPVVDFLVFIIVYGLVLYGAVRAERQSLG